MLHVIWLKSLCPWCLISNKLPNFQKDRDLLLTELVRHGDSVYYQIWKESTVNLNEAGHVTVLLGLDHRLCLKATVDFWTINLSIMKNVMWKNTILDQKVQC